MEVDDSGDPGDGGGGDGGIGDPCANSTATFCVTGTGQMPPNPSPPQNPNPTPGSIALSPTPGILTLIGRAIGGFLGGLGGVGGAIGIGILTPSPTGSCDTLSCQGTLPASPSAGPVPLTPRRESPVERKIRCTNQYAKDLQSCADAYPPGPERQACYAAAKDAYNRCMGIGVH